MEQPDAAWIATQQAALDAIGQASGIGFSPYLADGGVALVDSPYRRVPVHYAGLFRIAARRAWIVFQLSGWGASVRTAFSSRQRCPSNSLSSADSLTRGEMSTAASYRTVDSTLRSMAAAISASSSRS